jgi:hypothetical protein
MKWKVSLFLESFVFLTSQVPRAKVNGKALKYFVSLSLCHLFNSSLIVSPCHLDFDPIIPLTSLHTY